MISTTQASAARIAPAPSNLEKTHAPVAGQASAKPNADCIRRLPHQPRWCSWPRLAWKSEALVSGKKPWKSRKVIRYGGRAALQRRVGVELLRRALAHALRKWACNACRWPANKLASGT